jgi:hypothetical protein
MPLRLSGTIEPSAVDDLSFTGVASNGKLQETNTDYHASVFAEVRQGEN